MKVIEDRADMRGRYPLWFPKSATPADIYDWLFNNGYQSYMFCIVFNMMGDEYEEQGMTAVYFADEALDELAYYSGKEVIKKDEQAN